MSTELKKMEWYDVPLHHMKSIKRYWSSIPTNIAAASAPAAVGLIRVDDVKCGREVMSFPRSKPEGWRFGAGKLW